jgi:hypothetical protein
MSTFYDVLNAHYNYIASLFKYSSEGSVNSYSVYNQGTINTLTNLNNAINTNIGNQNNVLTQQSDVIRILDRENARLDQKKSSMDTVLQGQKRMNELNASYAKQYAAYNRIMLVIAVATLIVFLLYGFAGALLPAAIVSGLVILVIAITVVWVFLMLKDIWSRDPLNFDKLNPNYLSSANQTKTTASAYNSLFGDVTSAAISNLGCIGAQCCSGNTYFDTTALACMPGTGSTTSTSAFTNLEDAYLMKEIPFSLTSFNDAAPYEDKTNLKFDLI